MLGILSTQQHVCKQYIVASQQFGRVIRAVVLACKKTCHVESDARLPAKANPLVV